MAIQDNLFSMMLMAAFLKPAQLDATGKIDITIQGIENTEGKIMIKVFNSPLGYPGDKDKAFKIFSYKIRDKELQVVLNLPAGEYALAVNHEGIGNDRMDTNFVGVPDESLGRSHYSEVTPLTYEKAKFSIKPNEKISLTISIIKND